VKSEKNLLRDNECVRLDHSLRTSDVQIKNGPQGQRKRAQNQDAKSFQERDDTELPKKWEDKKRGKQTRTKANECKPRREK
jgi:hypothetical protein